MALKFATGTSDFEKIQENASVYYVDKSFLIAKAGKPLVKVMPLEAPEDNEMKRLGFMKGQIKIPDDFDQMGGQDIQQLFEGMSPYFSQ